MRKIGYFAAAVHIFSMSADISVDYSQEWTIDAQSFKLTPKHYHSEKTVA